MSGGSSQQVQQAQLDPEIKAAYLALLERAGGVAERLPARTIAPLGSGFEGAKAGIANAMADRGQTSDFAIGGLQRAINFTPQQIAAAQAARGNVRDVGATMGANLMAQYQNPFEAQVVQGALGDIERQRQIAQQAQQAKAVGARAFGGSRQAVAEALSNEDYTRQAAQTAAQLRSAGFTTAAGLAQQDAARMLQANLANQGIDVTLEQANAQLLQQANLANQQAGLTANQQRIAGSSALSDVGQQLFGQRMSQAQAMAQIAQTEQQLAQAAADAARTAGLEQQQVINQALALQPGGGAGTVSTGSSGSRQGILGVLGL